MAGKGDILNIRHLQILTSVSNLSSPFCCPIMYCKLIAPSYPRSLQYITLVVLRVLSFHFKNLKLFFPVEQQSVWCQQRNNGSTLGKYTHKQQQKTNVTTTDTAHSRTFQQKYDHIVSDESIFFFHLWQPNTDHSCHVGNSAQNCF